MCDTLCALKTKTVGGSTLFAKNSDRSPNEPHLVIRCKEQNHKKGSEVKLTYITIPQAEHTQEVILCKPSWTWGAEMGVNSASVAIGNEAVFTSAKQGPPALTGMDLVRLALERSVNARQAVSCITELLERYGQGGNCGYDHKFYYDNSFLIADPQEGYVVETSGRKWVAKQIKESEAISNRLCIRKEHTLRGGVQETYDFTGRLTEPVYTYFSGSAKRRASSLDSLTSSVDEAGMMSALRRHHPADGDRIFTHGSVRSVCMHAGGIIGDHTTGSLVVTLRADMPATLWCTAASTPCISAFKPVFFMGEAVAPVFEDEADAKRYWLDRETIHRGALAGKIDVKALQEARDDLEHRWLTKERKLFACGVPDAATLNSFANEAGREEQELVREFIPEDFIMTGSNRFSRYWQKKNQALEKA